MEKLAKDVIASVSFKKLAEKFSIYPTDKKSL